MKMTLGLYDACQDMLSETFSPCHVQFSIIQACLMEQPYCRKTARRMFNKIPIAGKLIFCEWHNPFWGGGFNYTSQVVQSPTWLEICGLANDMIHVTGDHHHIYLEGLDVSKLEPLTFFKADRLTATVKWGLVPGKETRVVRFSMGS